MQIQSRKQALEILAELNRRRELLDKLVPPSFTAQHRFVRDKARRKAALCTRRAGKSEGAGRALLEAALEAPGYDVLYINHTRLECKRIMWENIIKPVNDKLKLGGDPNEAELTLRLPNKSKVYLLGADAKPDEMKKFLGGKYRRVVIDEAASYKINLEKMVEEYLWPALNDFWGDLLMVGTPDQLTGTYFHRITEGEVSGWSVHKWSGADNPYIRENWLKDIAELKQRNPKIESTPSFKRMYLGQWVIDTDKLVYKYNPKLNLIDKLPGSRKDYIYQLSVDLGYEDDTAFTIGAYNVKDRNLYIIDTFKKRHMIISDVAKQIKRYQKRYPLPFVIVDGANKQAVKELEIRYGIAMKPADKTGKSDFIEMLNADLMQGYIKLIEDTTKPLVQEMEKLIWDESKLPKRVEHEACANHVCFVAGTKISTPKGKVNIEDLRKNDLVNTRFGPRKVNYCISSKSEVIRLQLSNGGEICTTKDHPFLVKGQWIAAQNLLGKELTVEKPSSSTVKTTIVEKTKNTLNQLQDICTEMYGSITTALFRLNIKSTTKMATSSTMIYPTWNVYQQNNTLLNIERKGQKELSQKRTWSDLKRSDRLQKSGIEVRKVESGTLSTAKRFFQTCLRSKLPVDTAEQNIINQKPTKKRTAVALIDALLLTGLQAVLMIFKESVNGAIRFLKPTNIEKKNAAPLTVVTITDIGITPVFNLNVDDVHEYFAEGVCVSNCDSFLYLWRYCYNYLAQPDEPELSEEQKIEKRLEEKSKQVDEPDFLEDTEPTFKPFFEDLSI